jgi:hypothetical protein
MWQVPFAAPTVQAGTAWCVNAKVAVLRGAHWALELAAKRGLSRYIGMKD